MMQIQTTLHNKSHKIFGNKHFKKSLAVIAMVVMVNFAAHGQEKKDKKVTVLPVPAIGYSPETKTYIGAVTLFTFNNLTDTLTRSSNASIEFVYTWNKQMIFETKWNYFFTGEKWFTKGRILHFSKYPDLYYGIGFDAPDNGELSFQSNRLLVDFDLFRYIKNKLFVGAGINYTTYKNVKSLTDSIYYPELIDENNFGIKIMFLKDSRNNILSPTKGNYFEFRNGCNFSSSFYLKTELDYRRYFSFGKTDGHTLAGRFYHASIFGNPPFYDFAMIGGDKYVRGYYLGRFRDKNVSSVQMELRNHLFWRVGIATFGGVSMVYPKISSIGKNSFNPNAGIGLRFLVDKNENSNLRFDYAIGAENQSGFYISFGESF